MHGSVYLHENSMSRSVEIDERRKLHAIKQRLCFGRTLRSCEAVIGLSNLPMASAEWKYSEITLHELLQEKKYGHMDFQVDSEFHRPSDCVNVSWTHHQ